MPKKLKKRKRISSFQIIAAGFAAVILTGTLLLMLPIASKEGVWTPFIDALFTATSAVCVTGLIVHDTATYWTTFGQAVIILLIQIGGMGVVTIALMFAMLFNKNIGLKQRSTMQSAISAPRVGGIVRLTRFIIKGVLLTEVICALIMAPTFIKMFGFVKGTWAAIFHSISAFCNAGFDLMGSRAQFSSLTTIAYNPIVNLIIMFLIVFGGIGFLVWRDMLHNKWKLRKYTLQSKVALSMTFILLVVPALFFFFYEFNLPQWGNLTGLQKFWLSCFQSVTPRTAGFNTADLTKLSEPSLVLTIILMLIGGSPGSTAGGMKTTTVAVIFLTASAVFKRRTDASIFHRRIANEVVREAITILLMYVMFFLVGGFMICIIEGLPIMSCYFEAASAIGTVGLTLGITPGLHAASKIILIIMMFFGRVGVLTLIFAALPNAHHNKAKLPEEQITVG